jgi:hypothetical protein
MEKVQSSVVEPEPEPWSGSVWIWIQQGLDLIRNSHYFTFFMHNLKWSESRWIWIQQRP